MAWFCDLSIKHKLIWLGVLSSASALILASAAFVFYDIRNFYDDMVRSVTMQAKIIGYNSAATILFFDPHSATQMLGALSTEPDIIAAGIYTRDGNLFASYTSAASGVAGSSKLPKSLAHTTEGHRFERNVLHLSQQIIFERRPIGTIVIQTSLDAMRGRVLQYIAIAVFVLLASTAASVLVSVRLQRWISHPILQLVETAKSVSQDKDYSVRAKSDSRDEMGLLVETFNEMLARIEVQNDDLQKANNELEQRVGERTIQLELANKELEAFSYSVSHDLRAPLRAVDGFSRIVLEDYASELSEEVRGFLKRVRESATNMGQLIDDLLTFSRLSRQPLKKGDIVTTELARQVLDELKQEQKERRIEVSVADLPHCMGDPKLLKQVFLNLLSNAFKYTRKRELASIEVGWEKIKGETVYFVKDNGAGFDMKYADKLFGVFQRLHRSEEYEGTGVGLAIVQRVINRHGGRIWAEAVMDRGANFYFTLGGGQIDG